jgi:hypothetical protein
MSLGIANTPLINYLFYSQSTTVAGSSNEPCVPILSVADAGNGQLLITTSDTSTLSAGIAITITSTTSYDGNYSVISLTPTTFNVSGSFVADETGCWELASNMSGANIGDPLDLGKLYFYDDENKLIFQNTYKDRALTDPYPNPIILDGVGSVPPIYLIDKAYYIEIYDKFNNLVATLDNYLPSAGGDTPPTASSSLDNLLPVYGFDIEINENIYTTESVPNIYPEGTPITYGWKWFIATTQTDALNTYEYVELGNSGLIGNPKNAILISSTNNTGGQTSNFIGSPIGTYNMFQGQQIAFSIYTRLISGVSDTLTVHLIRTKNGVFETPIQVGSLNISVTQSQEVITFTVPELTATDYDYGDLMYLVIYLPLNEDFQHEFTGTWAQLSETGDISITETPASTSLFKQWGGDGSSDQILNNPQYEKRGLPTALGAAGLVTLPMTGSISFGSASDRSSYAVSMEGQPPSDDGFELIRDKIIGNTQTNRLIDNLRAQGVIQSRLTFIADNNDTDTVSVKLGIGAAPNSSWQSLNPAVISVTKPVDEFEYKLEARTRGNGVVRFTFVDAFEASTVAYNTTYQPSNVPVYQVLPTPGPIISWIGASSFIAQNSPTEKNYFVPWVKTSVINPGSVSEQAIADVSFGLNCFHSHIINKKIDPGAELVRRDFRRSGSIYECFINGSRVVDDFGDQTTNEIQGGFLAYNDISSNPNPQELQPPRVINFGTLVGETERDGALSTLTVSLDTGDNADVVAAKVMNAVNTSFEYQLQVLAIPSNGLIVEISNSSTDFNLIYYDISQPKPVNPSSIREAIFVEYSPAFTLVQIAQATADAIQNGVIGVPLATDLALPFGIASGLKYDMFL